MSDQRSSKTPKENHESLEMPKRSGNKSQGIDETEVDVYSLNDPTWKDNLSYYFSQYCGATSIHGIQYIGERGRLFIEKIVWSIIIAGVWGICIFLISRTVYKWKTSPTIVTFATTETSISEIPFPAVTISPDAHSNVSMFNYTDVAIKKQLNYTLSEEEKNYYEAFSLFCENLLQEHFTTSGEERPIISEHDALSDNFMTSSQLIWKNKEAENASMLSLTREGAAISFNMLDYSEIFRQSTTQLKSGSKANRWSLDEGYPKSDQTDTFPKRTFAAGLQGGLIFLGVTSNKDSQYSCNIPFTGFKVTLHHPIEFPNMNKMFRLPLDQAVIVAIKPRVITISERLIPYHFEDRKCYLSSERQLKFFTSYTEYNCQLECVLNATLESCGCLPFYMATYSNTTICGPGKKACVENTENEIVLNEGNDVCGCLPSCTSLEYDVEISQTDWDFNTMLIRNRMFGIETFNDPDLRYSALFVYYKESQFLTTERQELYGYVDFFSNIGGLLGLLIGFSFTSLIEIIYFLTLRLGCNIVMFGQKFWSGAPELINKEPHK